MREQEIKTLALGYDVIRVKTFRQLPGNFSNLSRFSVHPITAFTTLGGAGRGGVGDMSMFL